VLSALAEFIKKHGKRPHEKNLTLDKAHEYLENFFDDFGYSVAIEQLNDVRGVTKRDSQNYLTSRFVMQEFQKESAIFRSIVEIAKGFFVYKAVYQIGIGTKKHITSKLNKTTFYLDTQLLIHLLGLRSKDEARATNEMVQMIKDKRGTVQTFTHCLEELKGIITAYANKPTERHTFNFVYFETNGYTTTDEIMDYCERVDLILESRGIGIKDAPEYGVVSSEGRLDNRGFLSQDDIKKSLSSLYSPESAKALERDVESIMAISRLRGGKKYNSLEKCGAIFVAFNTRLVRRIDRIYREEHPNAKVSWAISDIDLTTLLWLQRIDDKPNLPIDRLVGNAHAAHQPTHTVMEAFKKYMERLVEEGPAPEELLYRVLVSSTFAERIAEATANDSEMVTDELVRKIAQQYDDEIRADLIDEINELKKGVDQRKTLAYERAEFKASSAKRRANRVGRIVAFALILIGLAAILHQFIPGLYDEVFSLSLATVLYGLGVLLCFAGTFDTFLQQHSLFIGRMVSIIAQRRYDNVYEREVEIIKRHFGSPRDSDQTQLDTKKNPT
jgi:hypothetical protein